MAPPLLSQPRFAPSLAPSLSPWAPPRSVPPTALHSAPTAGLTLTTPLSLLSLPAPDPGLCLPLLALQPSLDMVMPLGHLAWNIALSFRSIDFSTSLWPFCFCRNQVDLPVLTVGMWTLILHRLGWLSPTQASCSPSCEELTAGQQVGSLNTGVRGGPTCP